MSVRKRRVDCTLEEWTEHRRALERGYDAKRRAKRREEGPKIPAAERRIQRTTIAKAPSSKYALDTALMAMEAVESSRSCNPPTETLQELEAYLRLRINFLKNL